MVKDLELLTVQEIANFLKVSIQTIYQWKCMGKIPSLKVNGRLLFNKAEVLEYYV